MRRGALRTTGSSCRTRAAPAGRAGRTDLGRLHL